MPISWIIISTPPGQPELLHSQEPAQSGIHAGPVESGVRKGLLLKQEAGPSFIFRRVWSIQCLDWGNVCSTGM